MFGCYPWDVYTAATKSGYVDSPRCSSKPSIVQSLTEGVDDGATEGEELGSSEGIEDGLLLGEVDGALLRRPVGPLDGANDGRSD